MNVSDELFQALMLLPPDFEAIEQLIRQEKYTPECMGETFCRFLEECFCEYSEFIEQYGRNPQDEEIHSTYVYPLCKIMLQYGLNPNNTFGEENSETNVMYEVYWLDKPYVAADTLKLLLEHGGDPLLQVDGESIWAMADFDLSFDVYEGYAHQDWYFHKFQGRFHYWLVLRGFLYPEEKYLREHALYTCNLVQIDKVHWDIQAVRKP